MIVKVAEHAGFCGGVKSAVNKALELAEKYGKIYTVGELVHNELVTENLVSNGVICLDADKLDTLKKGDVALIRAHGIEREKEAELQDKGVVLFDATCPVVKRNQNLAAEHAKAGEAILIVGDRFHDEVVGVLSYCGDNAVVIGDDEVEKFLAALDENLCLNGESEFLTRLLKNGKQYRFDGSNGVAVLFQTTILAEKYQKIEQLFNNFEKNTAKTFGIFNTICYTTTERQAEARGNKCFKNTSKPN